MRGTAHILGHEIVGRIARLGSHAAGSGRQGGGPHRPGGVHALRGMRVLPHGGLPLLPHDRPGASQIHYYGTTPVDVPPSLWGGYSQYLYVHPNCVIHRVPDHIPPAQAAPFLPMSNGVEWTYGYGDLHWATRSGPGPGPAGPGRRARGEEAGAAASSSTGLGRDTRAWRWREAARRRLHHRRRGRTSGQRSWTTPAARVSTSS